MLFTALSLSNKYRFPGMIANIKRHSVQRGTGNFLLSRNLNKNILVGGVNRCYCDGSTRFLKIQKSLDFWVFGKILTEDREGMLEKVKRLPAKKIVLVILVLATTTVVVVWWKATLIFLGVAFAGLIVVLWGILAILLPLLPIIVVGVIIFFVLKQRRNS